MDAGLPIKSVVDVEYYVKSYVVKQYLEAACLSIVCLACARGVFLHVALTCFAGGPSPPMQAPNIMRSQAGEYTERHRYDCAMELAQFIANCGIQGESNARGRRNSPVAASNTIGI